MRHVLLIQDEFYSRISTEKHNNVQLVEGVVKNITMFNGASLLNTISESLFFHLESQYPPSSSPHIKLLNSVSSLVTSFPGKCTEYSELPTNITDLDVNEFNAQTTRFHRPVVLEFK